MAEAALDRPELSRELTATEFARWYWLKTELVSFCRILGISARGSKPEVAARILAGLDGMAAPQALAPQLEYNRHTREYYRDHPGATRTDVIAAWRKRRSRPSA